MSAFDKQIDGNHYNDLVIEPFELAYLVADGDAGFCKLAKYLLRDKGERKVNLEKAKHVVELSKELFENFSRSLPPITPQTTRILQSATGTLVKELDEDSPGVYELALLAGFITGDFKMCIEVLDEMLKELADAG